jgi:large subunit ribosomal protein L18
VGIRASTPQRSQLSNIYAQVIDDAAGRTLVSASTIDNEIASFKQKNKTDAALLSAKLSARKCGITRVIFDRADTDTWAVAALAERREAGLEF